MEHRRHKHWGQGLVVSMGPILPVSGLQAVVMWPDLPARSGSSAVEHCPVLELVLVKEAKRD